MGICTLPSKTLAIEKVYPPTTPKQVHAFLGLVGYHIKSIKNFAKIAKPLTLLTRRQVQLEWTPEHQEAFMKLKDSIIQAPILRYPNPTKRYTVYTDSSDDTCRAQLTQEHNDMEFPIAFLSHTFSETQRKWSKTKQEAYGVYYAITKWNYYLQSADIIVRNDKTLTKFLNGKNANNKVNRWELELATYTITFEWISGAKNKAADCLSCLVELPSAPSASINMLSVINTDGPAFNTKSQTQQCLAPDSSTAQPSITPDIVSTPDPTPKSLTADRLKALLQMQKTDPFCKQISKCLPNREAPKHETECFTHVKGLLYKHITDSRQKFLALVILKSWKYTVLVEGHDKLGHQGNTHTYCLIKQQYY